MREFFLSTSSVSATVGCGGNEKIVRLVVETTVRQTYYEEHGRRGDGRRRSLLTRPAPSSSLAQVAVPVYPSS